MLGGCCETDNCISCSGSIHDHYFFMVLLLRVLCFFAGVAMMIGSCPYCELIMANPLPRIDGEAFTESGFAKKFIVCEETKEITVRKKP